MRSRSQLTLAILLFVGSGGASGQVISDAPRSQQPPYPRSTVITSLEWAPPSSIRRQAEGSDNWPLTWAADGKQYTAYGDGWGFEPKVEKKLSMGFAAVEGGPEDFQGINIRSASGERIGQGRHGAKASGILMVDHVLYLWVRNTDNAQLAWSRDRARTWSWSDWKFTTSFGCPTFLNCGANYEGAQDDYVYTYSFDSDSAYTPADRMVLARCPKDRITERESYTFFRGLNDEGEPVWTSEMEQRGSVFDHPGRCYRCSVVFHPVLKRYLLCQVHPESSDPRGPRFEGGFGIYDAPRPWGPWTNVYFTSTWDVGPGESASIPTKWMSPNGKTIHLVFSGDDHFSVRAAEFTLAR